MLFFSMTETGSKLIIIFGLNCGVLATASLYCKYSKSVGFF